MTPRLASLLAVLALMTSILPLPTGAPAAPESLALYQTGQIGQAGDSVAAPSGRQEAPVWDPIAPFAAAPSCRPDECAAVCAPLQGRCRSGSCFCLRDPL
jgi:hypothetical protein